MKRILGVVLFILFVGNVFGQSISQNNIPAVVLNAFQLEYPNAINVKWRLEKGNYIVKYKVNNKDHKLTMNFKGSVLNHSQDLYISELPLVVMETIRTKEAYFDMNDADKYEEGDLISYEIRSKKEGKNSFFWVTDQGQLLKYRRELKDSEVPASILNFINDQYGSFELNRSKYVEEKGRINYIVKVEIYDMEHGFWFDQKSQLLKHTQDLRDNEIPSPIWATLKSTYENDEVRDADFIEEKGKVSYRIRIRNSDGNIYLTFNTKGELLEVK